MKIITNKNFSLYIITFALFVGLICPALFSDGMFMDGLFYSTISRNLAFGEGSFWYLHLSDTVFNTFHEHPPLAMWLQSFLFRIFGDSIFIERIYSLVTALLTGLLIVIIWVRINKDNLKQYAWLPLLIWVLFPSANWSYANNLLENTVSVFLLISVLFMIQSLESRKILMLLLAGISIFAALLTKGFTALFPWSFLFFYWIFTKNVKFKRVIIDTFLLVLFTALPLIILLFSSEAAFDSLSIYINKQVIASIKGVKTVEYRFWIVLQLLNELLIPVGLMILTFIYAKYKKLKLFIHRNHLQFGLVLIFLGLSGVLPIMISMKQRAFYFIPALPFFAIGLSFLMLNILIQIDEKIKINKLVKKIFMYFSIFALIAALTVTVSLSGKIMRDFDKISDVYKITNKIPHKTKISISKSMYSDWSLYGYFYRYGYISLDKNSNNLYYLTDKKCKVSNNEYKKVNIKLKKYNLYKRREK